MEPARAVHVQFPGEMSHYHSKLHNKREKVSRSCYTGHKLIKEFKCFSQQNGMFRLDFSQDSQCEFSSGSTIVRVEQLFPVWTIPVRRSERCSHFQHMALNVAALSNTKHHYHQA